MVTYGLGFEFGEALRDGLDTMAITEHLEYQPYLEDIPNPDRTRVYQDAAQVAEDTYLLMKTGKKVDEIELEFEVLNALYAPKETAAITLQIEIEE